MTGHSSSVGRVHHYTSVTDDPVAVGSHSSGAMHYVDVHFGIILLL